MHLKVVGDHPNRTQKDIVPRTRALFVELHPKRTSFLWRAVTPHLPRRYQKKSQVAILHRPGIKHIENLRGMHYYSVVNTNQFYQLRKAFPYGAEKEVPIMLDRVHREHETY